jgi:hypothetical protein
MIVGSKAQAELAAQVRDCRLFNVLQTACQDALLLLPGPNVLLIGNTVVNGNETARATVLLVPVTMVSTGVRTQALCGLNWQQQQNSIEKIPRDN